MTIGERIKKRRIELGMSQEELAHKLGYKSRSSINKIELGGQNLTQPKIKKIADALDTTPDYIMGWDKDDDNHTDYFIKLGEGKGITYEAIEEYFRKLNQEKRRNVFDYLSYQIIMQDREDDHQ